MSEWKEYRLGDLVYINKHSIDKNYPHKIIEYLDTGSVTKGKIESFQIYKIEDAPSRARRLVNKNDIAISTVRPIQRHYTIFKEVKSNTVVSTGFAVVTCNGNVNPYFLYYYLTQDELTNYFDAIAEGSTSTYPSFKPELISELEISIPNLFEQQTVASILCSLDDKIDLLQHQNKTLEQLAETLFRQWFVEEADESWELGSLDDIAMFYNGKSRPQEVIGGKIPIYGGNGILGFTDKSNYDGRSIIIGRVGAYCGSLYNVRGPVWITDNALLAKPKEDYYSNYLSLLLKSLELNSMAEGSSHPLLTQTLLKSIELQKPSEQKIKLFQEHTNDLYDKVEINNNQIRILTQLRDTLLPKLMSGEVRVS
jgi:type I restriction enzyme S subunit